ncbi:unnamed protein product [Prorocentrum cordatum]|uniref:Reverse transcriptase domain-containing protein n=1 Tax=Prorocentrum cordatum TaxID=2364126 RepID=A0ABN9XHJ9_9DINO|nr:unnamed protein product [Polarella glacialis]
MSRCRKDGDGVSSGSDEDQSSKEADGQSVTVCFSCCPSAIMEHEDELETVAREEQPAAAADGGRAAPEPLGGGGGGGGGGGPRARSARVGAAQAAVEKAEPPLAQQELPSSLPAGYDALGEVVLQPVPARAPERVPDPYEGAFSGGLRGGSATVGTLSDNMFMVVCLFSEGCEVEWQLCVLSEEVRSQLAPISEHINRHNGELVARMSNRRPSGSWTSEYVRMKLLTVWIGTWPRPVLDKIRRGHYEQIEQNLPIAADSTGDFHRVAQSYVIIFPTMDKAMEFRLQQRQFSKLYTPMRDLVGKSSKWSEGCRLGVNGFKGTLFVTNGDDIWTLITTNQISIDQFNFVPVGDELADWGISVQQVEEIIGWILKRAQFRVSFDSLVEANESSLDPPAAVLEARPSSVSGPLSLSNADNEIASAAVASPLNAVAADVVDCSQRGPVAGRSLIDDLVESDARCQLWGNLRGLMGSGAVLLDFKQAFPSVFYDRVAAVLDRLGVPVCVRFAIRALCDQIWTMAPFLGLRFLGLQGCETRAPHERSAVRLFAVVLHRILIRVRRCPQSCEFILPCFAGDIALVARNLVTALPIVVKMLVFACQWAGLALNLDKYHIMVLHIPDKEPHFIFLKNKIPEMHIQQCYEPIRYVCAKVRKGPQRLTNALRCAFAAFAPLALHRVEEIARQRAAPQSRSGMARAAVCAARCAPLAAAGAVARARAAGHLAERVASSCAAMPRMSVASSCARQRRRTLPGSRPFRRPKVSREACQTTRPPAGG